MEERRKNKEKDADEYERNKIAEEIDKGASNAIYIM